MVYNGQQTRLQTQRSETVSQEGEYELALKFWCCEPSAKKIWGETEGLMLLFWRALFVSGREVRWEGGKGKGGYWGVTVGQVGGYWGGKVGKVGEWRSRKVRGSWFCSRVGDAGRVHDFVFLFLMLIKGKNRRVEFKIFLHGHRGGKTLLRSFTSC